MSYYIVCTIFYNPEYYQLGDEVHRGRRALLCGPCQQENPVAAPGYHGTSGNRDGHFEKTDLKVTYGGPILFMLQRYFNPMFVQQLENFGSQAMSVESDQSLVAYLEHEALQLIQCQAGPSVWGCLAVCCSVL